MDEQTQTPPDAGASANTMVDGTAGVPAADPAVAAPLTDEQKLERLLRRLTKGLVAAVAIFAVVYFFGQRQSHVEQAAPIPDQAVASAEAAVRQSPNDLDMRLKLAATYAQAKRTDDALNQLREILKVAPDYQPALLGLGEMLYSQGQMEEAQSALLKYVGIGKSGEFAAADPQLERAYYTLAMAEVSLGKTSEAISHFRTAVKIDSSDADAWYSLGQALLKTEAFVPAAEAFTRAVAFVPTGWCAPYGGLADAYAGSGDDAGVTFGSSMERVCKGGGLQSAAPLKELVKTEFATAALFGLGQAAEHDGDAAAAISYYQQILSIDRTDVAALSALARLGASPDPQPVQGK